MRFAATYTRMAAKSKDVLPCAVYIRDRRSVSDSQHTPESPFLPNPPGVHMTGVRGMEAPENNAEKLSVP